MACYECGSTDAPITCPQCKTAWCTRCKVYGKLYGKVDAYLVDTGEICGTCGAEY